MATAIESIIGIAAFLAIYVVGIDQPLKRYQPIYEQRHSTQLDAWDERNRT